MQFCPECEGLLVPRRGTDEMVCQQCGKVFKIDKKKAKQEYTLQHKINRKVYSKTPILEKRMASKGINDDERRAYEDYFHPPD